MSEASDLRDLITKAVSYAEQAESAEDLLEIVRGLSENAGKVKTSKRGEPYKAQSLLDKLQSYFDRDILRGGESVGVVLGGVTGEVTRMIIDPDSRLLVLVAQLCEEED